MNTEEESHWKINRNYSKAHEPKNKETETEYRMLRVLVPSSVSTYHFPRSFFCTFRMCAFYDVNYTSVELI